MRAPRSKGKSRLRLWALWTLFAILPAVGIAAMIYGMQNIYAIKADSNAVEGYVLAGGLDLCIFSPAMGLAYLLTSNWLRKRRQ